MHPDTCPTAVTVAPEGTDPVAPARPSRYQIVSELGRGGMGIVYRALDRNLGREVAMKVVSPGIRSKSALLRRFGREARITGQLQHPGIVPLYDFGSDGEGRLYFTMRLIEGRTLAALEAEEPFDLRRRLALFQEVCATVDFAHRRGVVHRDLKPQNVMIGDHGEVQVLDWGLARAPESAGDDSAFGGTSAAGSLTGAGDVLGTPEYMAPEQIEDAAGVDARADVYSLGAILYTLLAGRPPHRSFDRRQQLHLVLHRTPKRPQRKGASIPFELQAICLRALARDPAARYASARGLGEDVARFLAGAPVDAVGGGWRYRLRLLLRRRRGLARGLALAGLVLTLTCGGFLYADARDHAEQVAAQDRERDRALLATHAALEDVRRGLDRPGREAWRPTQAELIATLAAFPQPEVGKLLRQRLAALGAPDPDAADRAEIGLIVEALAAGPEPEHAVAALAEFLAGREDLEPVVAAGVALCNTRHPDAALPLFRTIRSRFGPGSAQWRRVKPCLERVPEEDGEEADPERLRCRAWLRYDRGRFAAALEDFQRLLADGTGARADWIGASLCLDAVGEPDSARASLDRALAQHPADAELLIARGRLLGRQGRQAEAIADFDRALAASATEEEHWEARYSQAVSQVKQGQHRAALAGFDAVLEGVGARALGFHHRGIARHALGDLEGALADYDRALELDPDLPECWAMRAEVLRQLGAVVVATSAADRAVALAPRSPLAHLMRARVVCELGYHEMALREFGIAIELGGDVEVDALVERARLLYKLDRHGDALADIEASLPLEATADAYSLRAAICWDLGQVEACIEDAETALALHPTNAEAALHLGLAHQSQGRFEPAVEAFDRLLVSPGASLDQRSVGRHERAWCLLNLGRLEEAFAGFDAVLALVRQPRAFVGRGFVRYLRGDLPGAVDDFGASLEAEPGDFETRYARALALRELGRAEEALADFDRACALAPDHAALRNDRGHLRLELGLWQQAAADFTRAIELDPTMLAAYNNRALVQARQGDLAGAIADLDAGIALDPYCDPLRVYRAQLQSELDTEAALAAVERF